MTDQLRRRHFLYQTATLAAVPVLTPLALTAARSAEEGIAHDQANFSAAPEAVRDLGKFLQPGTGGVLRAATAKLADMVSSKDYGAVGDGVANDTTALLNFFNYCISSGKHGFIEAGTYSIDEGILAFDTPFVDKAGPIIDTAGYKFVTFKGRATANAPFIKFTNGTATHGAGAYWRAGRLGGITFADVSGAEAASRHAISLRGVWGMTFGYMVGNDLRASLLYIEPLLYAGTNPDPYAVVLCHFDGLEANRCKGWAVYNGNYVGFNGCQIEFLRAIACESGVYFGAGAANTIKLVSAGSCAGWAFDDGTHATATGGAPSRFNVEQAELDDVQYGIRLNRTTLFEFKQIRFNHRFNSSALNPGGGYWPRTAIDIAGGVRANTSMGKITAVHRIEAGGTKPDIGVFLTGNNNSGIADVQVNMNILDSAGLGLVNTDLFTGIGANTTQFKGMLKGQVIFDTSIRVAVMAHANGTTTILNKSYPSAANKVAMPVEQYDRGNYFTTPDFVCPYDGNYFCIGQFQLAATIGTKIRIGICRDRGGTLTLFGNRTQFQQTIAAETCAVATYVPCLAGDKLSLMAEQNSGGKIAPTTIINHAADNFFHVSAL